ncbi:MAG TPA: hypothetical protein VN950_23825 [Terriglobales bacterium]|nr:hypothetical protein [Terriglobales bacterium]
MKSLLQLLRTKGELISKHTLLGYLPTRVRIVDAEHRPINAVQVGKQFLHGVEIITNLYPGTVQGEILSDLGSTNQLRFVHGSRAGKGFGSSWKFHVKLDPEQGAEEEFRLVECHTKTSGRAAIKTDLETDTHDKDTIGLEVNIL